MSKPTSTSHFPSQLETNVQVDFNHSVQHIALIRSRVLALALHVSGLRPLLCEEITVGRRDAVCARSSGRETDIAMNFGEGSSLPQRGPSASDEAKENRS